MWHSLTHQEDGDDGDAKGTEIKAADKNTDTKKKKKKQRDPNNPDEDEDEDSDEVDVAAARDGQIVVKHKEERTEEEIKLDESRPPSRPVSATFSERNALQASAVAAALEGAAEPNSFCGIL